MSNLKKKELAPLNLEEQLAAIGMMFSTRPLTLQEIESVDIESALANACVSLNEPGNQRLLGVILSWVSLHGSSVIIEKLTKILRNLQTSGKVVHFATLMALFATSKGHKRWKTLTEFTPLQPIFVGPPELVHSMIKLRGEENWSKDSLFRVPRGSASIESKWALSRNALAGINPQYRNRLIFGAQWRADIITAIEFGAKTPTEVSRKCGASYEPCHRVMADLDAAGLLFGKDKQFFKRRA